MSTSIISREDINYLTQQSSGKLNMILAGMTALLNDTDNKVAMMENQTWFQKMCRTISGKNKMTKQEIQHNHDKISMYMTQAMTELFEQQCIDHQVMMSLGNQLNELYAEHLQLKQMLGAFVSKLNEKIESVDNFHLLIQEIDKGVYSPYPPIVAICKILSQLDNRSILDDRKMNILQLSMSKQNILNESEYSLSQYLMSIVDVPIEEIGSIYIEMASLRENFMANIIVHMIECYHFLPDMARRLKNKQSVIDSVIAVEQLEPAVTLPIIEIFNDFTNSKQDMVRGLNTVCNVEPVENVFPIELPDLQVKESPSVGNPVDHQVASNHKIEHTEKHKKVNLPISIPEAIADKIEFNTYTVTDEYIVANIPPKISYSFFDIDKTSDEPKGAYYVWNRHSGKLSTFDIPDFSNAETMQSSENLVLLGHWNLKGIYVHNLQNNQQKIICTDCDGYGRFSVHKDNIAYITQDNQLIIYNLTTQRKQKVVEQTYSLRGNGYNLYEDKLFYHNCKEDAFSAYDLKTKLHRNLFDMHSFLVEKIVPYQSKVYVFLYNVYENYVALRSIDINNLSIAPIEHFRFSIDCSLGLESQIQVAPYFIFVKPEYKFPVYCFNMSTQILEQIASDCGNTYYDKGNLFRKSSRSYFLNSFQVVGDYLYFQRGEDREKCRISILNPDTGIMKL